MVWSFRYDQPLRNWRWRENGDIVGLLEGAGPVCIGHGQGDGVVPRPGIGMSGTLDRGIRGAIAEIDQCHAVGAMEDWSVNWTARGVWPDWGSEVNDAVGGTGLTSPDPQLPWAGSFGTAFRIKIQS